MVTYAPTNQNGSTMTASVRSLPGAPSCPLNIYSHCFRVHQLQAINLETAVQFPLVKLDWSRHPWQSEAPFAADVDRDVKTLCSSFSKAVVSDLMEGLVGFIRTSYTGQHAVEAVYAWVLSKMHGARVLPSCMQRRMWGEWGVDQVLVARPDAVISCWIACRRQSDCFSWDGNRTSWNIPAVLVSLLEFTVGGWCWFTRASQNTLGVETGDKHVCVQNGHNHVLLHGCRHIHTLHVRDSVPPLQSDSNCSWQMPHSWPGYIH